MKQPGMYCLYDTVAESFYPPFVATNDAVADRKFCQLLAAPEDFWAKNPQDYRLYRVGSFDEQTGVCTGLRVEEMVIVNPGLPPMGRRGDVARAEEEAQEKFAMWLATRGLEKGTDGKVRQLDRGAI